jgi:hypothetical protein
MRTVDILAAMVLASTTRIAFAQKTGSTPPPDVVTIDQTKAINANITSGDTAGFPVVVSAAGQ